MIKARELSSGQWFLHGENRYLVISLIAARYHRFPEGRAYGISVETGSIAAVDPETEVELIWESDAL